jgi:hypothetical protein
MTKMPRFSAFSFILSGRSKGGDMSDYRYNGGELIEIVLEAQKSDVSPMVRVKGQLKAALGTWGLRCLSVHDVTPALLPLPPAKNVEDGAAGRVVPPRPAAPGPRDATPMNGASLSPGRGDASMNVNRDPLPPTTREAR